MYKSLTSASASAAAAAIALVTPAFAAPASSQIYAEPRSIEVQVGDLDLASGSGNAALQRRIRNAANAICGRVPVFPLREKRMAETCHEEVLASTAEKVALAKAQSLGAVTLARRSE